ncbi:cell division protein ZapA [Acidihalobacter prosperus]|uniref:Cell division protein ZapA n=1 Tax=Acidihalobacter prosperus TaxID=160660 RepID=A0A1A6C0G5_9GAMM|nr:cell division protein ZapA [Acidihalobacter prosperus]OBS08052.1 Z-ring-associated protein ZapA [Acidihalobacter prosperus]
MSQVSVSVHILEREYQVMCEEDEREALVASAQALNGRMRDIRSTGRIVGGERIAVMTALNLIHELMQQKTAQSLSDRALAARLQSLDATVAVTLERIGATETNGTAQGS